MISSLCDFLTAADDRSVSRILRNQGCCLRLVHGSNIRNILPCLLEIFLLIYLLCLPELLHDLFRHPLSDGRGAGKARRLDAHRIKEARGIFYLAQDEIIVILMSPKSPQRR